MINQIGVYLLVLQSNFWKPCNTEVTLFMVQKNYILTVWSFFSELFNCHALDRNAMLGMEISMEFCVTNTEIQTRKPPRVLEPTFKWITIGKSNIVWYIIIVDSNSLPTWIQKQKFCIPHSVLGPSFVETLTFLCYVYFHVFLYQFRF